MHIGILQTGHAPDTLLSEQGDYDHLFHQLLDGHGFEFQTFNVVDGEFPNGPQDADGWLITGSRHGAYEDLIWIPPLETLIREISDTGRPLVGVCFGHQIIAQALGGKVEKFAGGWSVGPTAYRMNGRDLTLHAWHQDQVVERPAKARVVGSNTFCENAMLAYGDRILTVQAHPEFGSDFIDGLIRTRGKGIVPDERLANAAANLNRPTDRAEFAAQIAAFFKTAEAS